LLQWQWSLLAKALDGIGAAGAMKHGGDRPVVTATEAWCVVRRRTSGAVTFNSLAESFFFF
jgi:hypothetical protein